LFKNNDLIFSQKGLYFLEGVG